MAMAMRVDELLMCWSLNRQDRCMAVPVGRQSGKGTGEEKAVSYIAGSFDAVRVSDIALLLMLCTQFCSLTGGGSFDVNLSRATFLLYCLVAFSTDMVPLIKGAKSVFAPCFYWACLFWALAFTSLLWSPDISQAFNTTYVNNAIRIIALCFFMPARFRYSDGIAAYMRIFIVLCCYIVVAVIIKTPASHWGTERVGSSIGLNQNNLGMLLAYGAFISFSFALLAKKKVYFLVCLPFVVISLMTGSRKSFLLLCVLPVLFALFYKRGLKRFMLIGIGLLFVYALWNLVVLQPDLYNVIGRRLDGASTGGAGLDDMRELYRQFGWSLFLERPLFGYGMTGFEIMVPQAVLFSRDVAYSHCNYTELLSCFGIVGFFLYYSLYGWIVLVLLRNLKSDSAFPSIALSVLIGLLITDYGNVSYPELSNLVLLMIPYLTAAYVCFDKNEDSKWSQIASEA